MNDKYVITEGVDSSKDELTAKPELKILQVSDVRYSSVEDETSVKREPGYWPFPEDRP